MNTPEEQEYIRKNTSWWDRRSMDLIYLTVVSGLLTVAYGIVLTVVSGEDIELTLKFLYTWGPLAAVSVALNVRGARRINRLLEEFRQQRIEK